MNSTLPIRHNGAQARLAAIVLAAGYSSRMGLLKPLLPLAGAAAVERCIALFRDAGIDEVIVVLGNRAEELRPLAKRYGAHCAYNARFDEGMYSSVVAGAKALPANASGAFVLPADVPLVREITVRQLAAAFLNRPGGILYPVFDQRRGHPPLIARSILNEVASGAPGPLCALLNIHEQNAREVPVADEAIHLDMDTPEDFETVRALAGRREIPTTGECEAMLAHHHVPEAVIQHSRKVSEVAGQMADALLATGLSVDPELVRAGALLHDLAKGLPKHAEAGAAILRANRMPAVANVIAAHTEIKFAGAIDERAIVYLADKLVRDDRLVTIEERFERALDRFRQRPDGLKSALRRKAAAQQIAGAIEARLGIPLFSILARLPALPAYGRATSRALEATT